jgi:hypothetical protein
MLRHSVSDTTSGPRLEQALREHTQAWFGESIRPLQDVFA